MSKIEFNEYVKNEKNEFDTFSIYQMIRQAGPVTWSWGTSNFTNFFNKGLTFSVNGFKHKGIVAITYNRVPDLFNVELRTRQYNLKEEVTGVYIDQLIDVIDSLVETDNDQSDEYKNQVENSTYTI